MEIKIDLPAIRLANKLARYLWGCRRKVRYGHAETAENAIRRMEKKGSVGLSKYECEFCGAWHIGH